MTDKRDTTTALAVIVKERGISEPIWRTLSESLYPGANPHSVLLVWDYCQARKLDPLKKPVHIVPMRVKDAVTGQYNWRDVVMPGIYEHRITAQRTKEYLGHSKPEYGPEIEFLGVKAPEWCAMTFYRWNDLAKQKVEFPVQVFFREVCGTSFDKDSKTKYVNERWQRAPIQMLTKCTEGAGVREGWPEELGGLQTAEEMDGQERSNGGADIIDITHVEAKPWDALTDEGQQTALNHACIELEKLGTTPAQLHARLNDIFTKDPKPETAVATFLDWARDEFANKKTGQPRKKADNSNSKKKPAEAVKSAEPDAPATEAAPEMSESPPAAAVPKAPLF